MQEKRGYKKYISAHLCKRNIRKLTKETAHLQGVGGKRTEMGPGWGWTGEQDEEGGSVSPRALTVAPR